MTRWQEFPLRQPGQPWPGLDTLGGRLDDGRGQMTDESTNVIINTMDTLSKRKGMIRGLNEQFDDVVCGLHKYTDICGREYLLVADATQINIRTPFTIPVFTLSDAYPSDSFTGDGDVDTDNWRNTSSYVQSGGSLVRLASASEVTSRFTRTEFLRWFKDAANLSYQVQIQYQFSTASARSQVASIAIKGNGDLSTGAFIQGDIEFTVGGDYVAKIFNIRADGAAEQIATLAVSGSVTNPSGFFTLTYTRDPSAQPVATYIPSISVVPIGGALQTLEASSLTTLQDADLGQVSAIGVGKDAQVLIVSGGPV